MQYIKIYIFNSFGKEYPSNLKKIFIFIKILRTRNALIEIHTREKTIYTLKRFHHSKTKFKL